MPIVLEQRKPLPEIPQDQWHLLSSVEVVLYSLPDARKQSIFLAPIAITAKDDQTRITLCPLPNLWFDLCLYHANGTWTMLWLDGELDEIDILHQIPTTETVILHYLYERSVM